MAEFIDIVIYHDADGSPSVNIEDDHGKGTYVGLDFGWKEDEYGGFERRIRIQHDEIEKL